MGVRLLRMSLCQQRRQKCHQKAQAVLPLILQRGAGLSGRFGHMAENLQAPRRLQAPPLLPFMPRQHWQLQLTQHKGQQNLFCWTALKCMWQQSPRIPRQPQSSFSQERSRSWRKSA